MQQPSPTLPHTLRCSLHLAWLGLQVYFVWTGTDVNGEYFESANNRFSRFRAFGVGSLYDGAVSLGDKVRAGSLREIRCPDIGRLAQHCWVLATCASRV